MLFNESVSITIENKCLIKNSQLQIEKNKKYCMIGNNGCGKTTLMNHIYNTLQSKFDILYVKQSEIITEDCPIYEYMLLANTKLYELYLKFSELEKQIEID